ncbi:unnamed protein product [Amoebophrya sp. A120]|nr:unnamed protein product [Amoebophrya sp. A120]|eukprot:GSA120T00009691001.1
MMVASKATSDQYLLFESLLLFYLKRLPEQLEALVDSRASTSAQVEGRSHQRHEDEQSTHVGDRDSTTGENRHQLTDVQHERTIQNTSGVDLIPDLLTILFITEWVPLDVLTLIGRHTSQRTADGKITYQNKPYSLDFHRKEFLLYYDNEEAEEEDGESKEITGWRDWFHFRLDDGTDPSTRTSTFGISGEDAGVVGQNLQLTDEQAVAEFEEEIVFVSKNVLVVPDDFSRRPVPAGGLRQEVDQSSGSTTSARLSSSHLQDGSPSRSKGGDLDPGPALSPSSFEEALATAFPLQHQETPERGDPKKFKHHTRIYSTSYNPLVMPGEEQAAASRDFSEDTLEQDVVSDTDAGPRTSPLLSTSCANSQSVSGSAATESVCSNAESVRGSFVVEPAGGFYGKELVVLGAAEQDPVAERELQQEEFPLERLREKKLAPGTTHFFNLSWRQHFQLLQQYAKNIQKSLALYNYTFFSLLAGLQLILELYQLKEEEQLFGTVGEDEEATTSAGVVAQAEAEQTPAEPEGPEAGQKQDIGDSQVEVDVDKLQHARKTMTHSNYASNTAGHFENDQLLEALFEDDSGSASSTAASFSLSKQRVDEKIKIEDEVTSNKKRTTTTPRRTTKRTPDSTPPPARPKRRLIPRVHVTILWGERLSKYLKNFLKRAKAFDLDWRFFVFALDEVAYESCKVARSSGDVFDSRINQNLLCIEGSRKTIYNKYVISSVINRLGFDVVYQDFDTVFLKDPNPLFDRYHFDPSIDIVTGRDFGVNCANTGVLLFKATPATQLFLQNWLVWTWWHPYEFSQKTFSSFFDIEKTAMRNRSPPGPGFYPDTAVRKPRLKFFESINTVVTQLVYGDAEGWYGAIENIVIFHFVDGTGGVDETLAVQGRYVNAFDVFYDNENLDLLDPQTPLHVQDQSGGLAQFLLRSRHAKPPERPLKQCVLYISTEDP